MLVSKTLRTLQRGNFRDSLYVVVPSDQVAEYQRAVNGNPIHCVILHTEKGLVKQRQFFRDMMSGMEIVFIDDDIEAIKIKSPNGLSHCANVSLLANYVFQMMANTDDCLLAGVYPMANRTWMKPTVFTANSYVVGALYFCRNDQRLLEPHLDECEDWGRQLNEQAAGRPVLRLNFVGVVTQYWKNAGGLQDTRNDEIRNMVVDYYCNQYSSIVKKRVRRDGHTDIQFINRPVTWREAPLPTFEISPSVGQSTALEPLAEQPELSSPDDSTPE